MRRFALLIWVLIAVTSSAGAIVFGATNFDFQGYPDHDCYTYATKPYRPLSFSTQWEVDQFNMELEAYFDDVRQFVTCIDDYREAARKDIERIKEKANDAIEEANLKVSEANSL